MTQHEEAVRLPEPFWQWMKDHSHRTHDGYWLYVNTNDARKELADLIADVRRQAMEEDATAVMKIAMKHCNKQQTEYFDDIGPALEMAAEAIRSRLEE